MRDLERPATAAGRRQQLFLTLALVAVVTLGAALRFHGLASQSLWNDEGTSVVLAQRSLVEITRDAAADIHPPFYHYLLHFWLLVFGPSEAGARSLSAAFGVGLVGLIYLMGRRWFGPLAGLLAALVIAISSYQVYYAQEARMYMLLTALGAASTYLFYLGWLEPGAHECRAEEPRGNMPRLRSGRGRHEQQRWAMAGWVVVTALVLYTQYLGITVVLAQNAAWAASLLPAYRRREEGMFQPWRQAATWVAAQALVAALYVPWLRLTWDQLHTWPAVSAPFGLVDLLRQALPLFTLGPLVRARALWGLAAAVLGLAMLGLLAPDRPPTHSRRARLLTLLHCLMPVAVLYYLSRSRPVYHPKFLLIATPGFALLVARGVARLLPVRSAWPERGGWLRYGLACCAGLAVVAASLPGLRNYYYDPRYARDDYRGIARYIQALGRPGDVVLINAPSQVETVGYYYRGPLPLVPLPRERPPDRERTAGELAELSRKAERIFGIFWATNESDPERVVEGWLDSHAYKALDAWYGNVRLVIYAMPSAQMEGGIQHPLAVNLGGQVRLDGYSLASTEVAAGDILQLNLFWEAINVIPRRYKVFTHVIDEAGRLVGQRDAEPGGGTNYTNTWREGERVSDRYGLPILPGTAPGEYLIEVGMYNPDDGQRLPVVEGGQATGDHVILQKVRIVRPATPPPLAALDMQHRRLLKGDDIQLLGFSFGKLGAGPEQPPALKPGDVVELVLFWQAVRVPQSDLEVLVRVVDAGGRMRLESATPPVGGRYPLSHWQPQEIVRDPLHLVLPGDLLPGRYRLFVGWQGKAPTGAAPHASALLTFTVQ